MKKVSCIICEDEPLAQKQMISYVESHNQLEVKKIFSNGLDALRYLENNEIDLVFFDIQMPQLNGLDLAKMARKMDLKFKLIFTTAYSEYAVDSYKVNADDYLMKPFSKKDFEISANKVIEKLTSVDTDKQEVEWDNDFIFVKSNYQVRKICFKDVLYFEGLKDYIQIFLKGEKHPVLILTSFKKVMERLPQNTFMRIHRSYIVNLTAVEKVEKNRIIFNNVYIPISEANKEKFFLFLNKNSLG